MRELIHWIPFPSTPISGHLLSLGSASLEDVRVLVGALMLHLVLRGLRLLHAATHSSLTVPFAHAITTQLCAFCHYWPRHGVGYLGRRAISFGFYLNHSDPKNCCFFPPGLDLERFWAETLTGTALISTAQFNNLHPNVVCKNSNRQ